MATQVFLFSATGADLDDVHNISEYVKYRPDGLQTLQQYNKIRPG